MIWKTMCFECTAQETYSRFSVLNQKEEAVWEGTTKAS